MCYTSANQTVYLYDGSTLQITSAFVKDRTNNIYKNFPIGPDIQTNNAKSSAIVMDKISNKVKQKDLPRKTYGKSFLLVKT